MATRLTPATPVAPSLEETDGRHELYDGEMREKPPMSFGHNRASRELVQQLLFQLPRGDFVVLQNAGHASIPGGNSYIPDVAIVGKDATTAFEKNPRSFERYSDPLPFVVEIWSPSTGSYDIDRKIPGYISRGDLEIWRVHPFDRIVTVWRRQLDGSYIKSQHNQGEITLHALPQVTIVIELLFGPA